MNLEKVVFGFFILLAATLNFGFVYGDVDNPLLHDEWELFAAVVVNLIAAVLKFGDRTHIGAVHLASSLVALLQLAAATVVWVVAQEAGALSPAGDRARRVAGRRGAARQHRLGRHHGGRDDDAAALRVGTLFFLSIRRLRAPLVSHHRRLRRLDRRLRADPRRRRRRQAVAADAVRGLLLRHLHRDDDRLRRAALRLHRHASGCG